MELTLQISNADENLLKALKGVVNLYPQSKLKVTKQKETINGLSNKFENELLKDLQKIDNQIKNGTLKTYNNTKEAFKAEGII